MDMYLSIGCMQTNAGRSTNGHYAICGDVQAAQGDPCLGFKSAQRQIPEVLYYHLSVLGVIACSVTSRHGNSDLSVPGCIVRGNGAARLALCRSSSKEHCGASSAALEPVS